MCMKPQGSSGRMLSNTRVIHLKDLFLIEMKFITEFFKIMSKIFIDTNIVVYANDSRFPDKQEMANDIIERLMKNGNGVISTQVLHEYAAVALQS